MKNSGFATRVASAIVLVIVILAAGVIGRELLLLLLLTASVIGLHEIYSALSLRGDGNKNSHLFIVAVICEVVFYGCVEFIRFDIPNMIAGFIILVLMLFMIIYVFTFPKYDFKDIAYAFTGFVYVVIFMSFVFFTRCLSDGKYLFWLIFISSWICDTCAYLVGCTIGKHKLAPVLSPKKSIEGALGGIAGAVIVAYVFGYFVEYKLFNGVNHAGIYMIICAFGAIVSQIGDLTASGIKRNHEIKDYGKLIPGHGGILDRFDSVIFVAPVIYLLSVFLL